MASKNTTQVLIGGKIYTMSGYESEDYLQRVAAYLNNKLTEIKTAEGYARMSQDMRSLLLNLNTVDDYFKLKEKTDQLSESIASKDKELYEIKHELIQAQMQLETLTRELEAEKEAQLEAQKELTQLRTRLEDVRQGLSTAPTRFSEETPDGAALPGQTDVRFAAAPETAERAMMAAPETAERVMMAAPETAERAMMAAAETAEQDTPAEQESAEQDMPAARENMEEQAPESARTEHPNRKPKYNKYYRR